MMHCNQGRNICKSLKIGWIARLFNYLSNLRIQFINNVYLQTYSMTCNGTCIRYKVSSSGNKHYGLGHKRCSTCEIFIKWDGLHCPCCNVILRTRPKSASGRYQLLLVRQSTKNRWSDKLQLSVLKSFVMYYSFNGK